MSKTNYTKKLYQSQRAQHKKVFRMVAGKDLGDIDGNGSKLRFILKPRVMKFDSTVQIAESLTFSEEKSSETFSFDKEKIDSSIQSGKSSSSNPNPQRVRVTHKSIKFAKTDLNQIPNYNTPATPEQKRIAAKIFLDGAVSSARRGHIKHILKSQLKTCESRSVEYVCENQGTLYGANLCSPQKRSPVKCLPRPRPISKQQKVPVIEKPKQTTTFLSKPLPPEVSRQQLSLITPSYLYSQGFQNEQFTLPKRKEKSPVESYHQRFPVANNPAMEMTDPGCRFSNPYDKASSAKHNFMKENAHIFPNCQIKRWKEENPYELLGENTRRDAPKLQSKHFTSTRERFPVQAYDNKPVSSIYGQRKATTKAAPKEPPNKRPSPAKLYSYQPNQYWKKPEQLDNSRKVRR